MSILTSPTHFMICGANCDGLEVFPLFTLLIECLTKSSIKQSAPPTVSTLYKILFLHATCLEKSLMIPFLS